MWFSFLPSSQDIRCDQLILFLEGQNCPLSPRVYFIRPREVTLSEVQLPFWIMSVSCNQSTIIFSKFASTKPRFHKCVHLEVFPRGLLCGLFGSELMAVFTLETDYPLDNFKNGTVLILDD